MEDQIKLKPCPFCGGEAHFRCRSNKSSHYEVGFEFEIACTCGMKLPNWFEIEFCLSEDGEISIKKDEREKAIAAWNRRFAHDD